VTVRAFDARSAEAYEGGREFGATGGYEIVRGVVHYAVDPRAEASRRIVDLDHAPPARADGMVHFDADLVVLRPADPGRGSGTLVYSVANRGMVASLPFSTGAFAMPGVSDRVEPGDGFLLGRGHTVVWSGWQWDVVRGAGMVGLGAPDARAPDGGPLPGQVRMRLQPPADTPSVPLTGMALLPTPPPYRPRDLDDPDALLTARERPEDDGWVVPRATWRFGFDDDGTFVADPTALWVEGGLQGGLIYDVVYRPDRSPVVGAGLLAIRDTVSWLRWGTGDVDRPAGPVDVVCATGASQSGRLLRQFLHDGMNVDEQGRSVFDGVHVHIAGGRRGEFNTRFGQPGVIWRGVGDSPPWSTAALLDRQRAVGGAPKVVVTNSASEYWRGDGWLAHGDPELRRDVDDPPDARHYLLSGVDHFGDLGELAGMVPARNAATCLDGTLVERALFVALERWVRDGIAPPPSRVPRLDDGTAVDRATVLAVAARRGLATPDVDALPGSGPGLVSAVDADGNEVAGVRLPAVAEPVATYTGWNVRPEVNGLPALVPDFVGSCAPLADVAARYPDPGAYAAAARAAARVLATDGYLLADDLDALVEQTVAKYPGPAR
jgi:hypothetical protein